MTRSFAMMVLALSVSGCAVSDDPMIVTGSVRPVAPTLIADVSPDYAAAYLPGVAGGIQAVRQSSRPGQIFQSVLYPNPGYGSGENKLEISIAPPSAGSAYTRAPTQREIVSGMRAALPGARMQISSAVGQNAHGRFGHAFGRQADGSACIYAWQTVADIGRAAATGFGRLTRSRYAAKVRLHYCHPSMDEPALVSLMNGLRIREVTDGTIEMLRFAEGSGVAARRTPPVTAAAPVSEPVARPAVVKRVPTVAADAPTGPSTPVLTPAQVTGKSSATVRQDADVAGTAPAAGSSGEAALVPLPGDVKL